MRWILSLLIPGVAHINQHRPGRGLIYFFLFAAQVNLYFIGPWVSSQAWVPVMGLVGAGMVWLVCAIDALRGPRVVEEDEP